jgi:hypothetical protein
MGIQQTERNVSRVARPLKPKPQPVTVHILPPVFPEDVGGLWSSKIQMGYRRYEFSQAIDIFHSSELHSSELLSLRTGDKGVRA